MKIFPYTYRLVFLMFFMMFQSIIHIELIFHFYIYHNIYISLAYVLLLVPNCLLKTLYYIV